MRLLTVAIQLLEFDGIDVLEGFVAGNDDALLGLDTLRHFDEFAVAASQAYVLTVAPSSPSTCFTAPPDRP